MRKETKPEDVPAFFSSEGILTSLGGKSSHAAIVSRGMGKPCIVGCSELKIDYDNNIGTANGMTIKEGETITIDGSEGTVFIGEIPTVEPKVTKDFEQILQWAQKTKTLELEQMQILQKWQNLQESLEVKELDYVEQKECLMEVIELIYL